MTENNVITNVEEDSTLVWTRRVFKLRWFSFLVATCGLSLILTEYVYLLTRFLQGVLTGHYPSLGFIAPLGYFLTACALPVFLALSAVTHLRQNHICDARKVSDEGTLLHILGFRLITEKWIKRGSFALLFFLSIAVLYCLYWIPNLLLGSYYELLPYIWDFLPAPSAKLFISKLALTFLGFSLPSLFLGTLIKTRLTESESRVLLPASTFASTKEEISFKIEEKEEGNSVDIVAAHQDDSRATCPVCRTTVKDEGKVCPRCHTKHHEDCWDYSGGCAIFGCDSRRPCENRADENAITITEDGSLTKKEENFVMVKEQTERWLQAYGRNWLGFCLAAFGIIAFTWSAFIPFAIRGRSILLILSTYWGMATYFGGIFFCVLGLLLYFTSLLPLMKESKQLEEVSSLKLSPPQGGGRAVLDRLETPPATNIVLYALVASPAISIFTMLLLPLLMAIAPYSYYPMALVYRFAIVLMGIAFTIGVFLAARKRAIFQQSIQNRIEASLKTLKDLNS